MSLLSALTSCDEDGASQPADNRNRIFEWKYDTIRSEGDKYVVQPWHMLILDTTHVVFGGNSQSRDYTHFELIGDSLYRYDQIDLLSGLAKAKSGYYAVYRFSSFNISLYRRAQKEYTWDLEGPYVLSSPSCLSSEYDGKYYIGTSPGDIYVFDGEKIHKQTVDLQHVRNGNYRLYITDITRAGDEFYAVASLTDPMVGGTSKGYLFQLEHDTLWSCIDSTSNSRSADGSNAHFGSSYLYATEDGDLYSVGIDGAFKMDEGGEWEHIIKSRIVTSIEGTGSGDVYFGDVAGDIWRYDGTSVSRYNWPLDGVGGVVTNIKFYEDRIYIMVYINEIRGSVLLRGRPG